MITRKIGFDVVYQQEKEVYTRERVRAIQFSTDGSGYDEAMTASGKKVQLNPLYAFLLQFTGEFDRAGAPVHHGDLLADDDGIIFEVMFYNGAYWLHAPGDEEGKALDNQSCATLRIVGDVIRNASMIVPPNAEAVVIAATERKVPFVNLPLAG